VTEEKEVEVLRPPSRLRLWWWTTHKFWDFVVRHELVTYLTLVPSFILTVISLSPISVGIFAFHVILVLVGTSVMFKKHALEKSVEFTKKLGVFVEELKNKTDPAYIYSLPIIALEVARSEKISKKTQAWDKLLSKLTEDLITEICSLHERIKNSDGKNFLSLLTDFGHTLGLLGDFKKRFYEMVNEYEKIQFAVDFGQDKQFHDRFERLSKEYNGYMNRLVNFSDDLKAEMNIKADDKMFEHICSAKELFMTQ
jgi:hypothetical protein